MLYERACWDISPCKPCVSMSPGDCWRDYVGSKSTCSILWPLWVCVIWPPLSVCDLAPFECVWTGTLWVCVNWPPVENKDIRVIMMRGMVMAETGIVPHHHAWAQRTLSAQPANLLFTFPPLFYRDGWQTSAWRWGNHKCLFHFASSLTATLPSPYCHEQYVYIEYTHPDSVLSLFQHLSFLRCVTPCVSVRMFIDVYICLHMSMTEWVCVFMCLVWVCVCDCLSSPQTWPSCPGPCLLPGFGGCSWLPQPWRAPRGSDATTPRSAAPPHTSLCSLEDNPGRELHEYIHTHTHTLSFLGSWWKWWVKL